MRMMSRCTRNDANSAKTISHQEKESICHHILPTIKTQEQLGLHSHWASTRHTCDTTQRRRRFWSFSSNPSHSASSAALTAARRSMALRARGKGFDPCCSRPALTAASNAAPRFHHRSAVRRAFASCSSENVAPDVLTQSRQQHSVPLITQRLRRERTLRRVASLSHHRKLIARAVDNELWQASPDVSPVRPAEWATCCSHVKLHRLRFACRDRRRASRPSPCEASRRDASERPKAKKKKKKKKKKRPRSSSSHGKAIACLPRRWECHRAKHTQPSQLMKRSAGSRNCGLAVMAKQKVRAGRFRPGAKTSDPILTVRWGGLNFSIFSRAR